MADLKLPLKLLFFVYFLPLLDSDTGQITGKRGEKGHNRIQTGDAAVRGQRLNPRTA